MISAYKAEKCMYTRLYITHVSIFLGQYKSIYITAPTTLYECLRTKLTHHSLTVLVKYKLPMTLQKYDNRQGTEYVNGQQTLYIHDLTRCENKDYFDQNTKQCSHFLFSAHLHLIHIMLWTFLHMLHSFIVPSVMSIHPRLFHSIYNYYKSLLLLIFCAIHK